MNSVNKFGKILFVLMLLSSAATLFALTPESQTLKFTLAIEEKPLEAENTPGTVILIVKYTNISDTVQRDPCAVTPWEYKITVLRDGVPLAKKNLSTKKTDESDEIDESQHPIHIMVLHRGSPCSMIGGGLKPGQSVKFTLWVSSQYDMTVPGSYDITVTRETDPWNPDKSVTVRSNTITIIVPEPGASSPQ
jgi:hypothetical protein